MTNYRDYHNPFSTYMKNYKRSSSIYEETDDLYLMNIHDRETAKKYVSYHLENGAKNDSVFPIINYEFLIYLRVAYADDEEISNLIDEYFKITYKNFSNKLKLYSNVGISENIYKESDKYLKYYEDVGEGRPRPFANRKFLSFYIVEQQGMIRDGMLPPTKENIENFKIKLKGKDGG